MQSETGASPNTISPQPNKQNVARGCVATAFQLTYNALLVADAKWPRQDDGLAQTHGRLQKDTQNELDELIAGTGFNDASGLRKTLDRFLHDYPTPPRPFFPEEDAEQDGNHEFQLPSMAHLLEQFRVAAERNLNDAKTAAPPRKLHPEQEPREVLGKIQEIVSQSRDGDYIFRGEPMHHEKVTSSLYRRYRNQIETGGNQPLNISFAQTELLKEAKGYAKDNDDFDLSTRLQHYGGKTNLIDFTTDYRVALFFACDGGSDDDGRVILLRKSKAIERGHEIITPQIQDNRVSTQESIFVQTSEDHIKPDSIITIPSNLKTPMLDYLRNHHELSPITIYNDLHGYIKYQELHHSAYEAFFEGIKHHLKGRAFHKENQNDLAESEFDNALRYYNRALAINPQSAIALNHRGDIHNEDDNLSCALKDYDRAIELQRDYADAYFNRGLTYNRKRDYEFAIRDFSLAIHHNFSDSKKDHFNRALAFLHLKRWGIAKSDLTVAANGGINLVAARKERYPTITALEESIGAALPEDIAEMLG